MLFPLLVRFLEHCPLVETGRIVLGNIEQCGRRWQAAARFGRIGHGKVPVRPVRTSYERSAAAGY
jgi:hypothetical protein